MKPVRRIMQEEGRTPPLPVLRRHPTWGCRAPQPPHMGVQGSSFAKGQSRENKHVNTYSYQPQGRRTGRHVGRPGAGRQPWPTWTGRSACRHRSQQRWPRGRRRRSYCGGRAEERSCWVISRAEINKYNGKLTCICALIHVCRYIYPCVCGMCMYKAACSRKKRQALPL